jgi:hypothetical protein
MMYVACDPKQPGAAYAACVDDPRFTEWTAEDVRQWLLNGAEVKLVEDNVAIEMIKAWTERDK